MSGVSPEDISLDWELLYRTSPAAAMPWYLDSLDPDIARTVQELNIHVPAVLDLGTGPGTQVIELARRGFDATGSDISAAAVRNAAVLAYRRGAPCQFVQDDILQTQITRRFDFVIDRGVLHNLPQDKWPLYVQNVGQLLIPGGYLLLKCYSHRVTQRVGVHKFHVDEISALFTPSFEVLSIRDSVYHGNIVPPPPTLFCVLRKR